MIIFYPISLLYGALVFLREYFYKVGIFSSYKVKTKILSVGNLTFGGTGKTPVVDFLLENLKKNKKLAVISRGYGRESTGFFKVTPNTENAVRVYGDEPLFISQKHSDVPVYVCEDRVEGCRKIESQSTPDMIIADDAFQHLKLKRNIDVVVVDATEKLENYNYPPVGRARNSFSYLNRANYVFLTRTNICSKEDLDCIRSKLKNHTVYEFESLLDGVFNLKTNQLSRTVPAEVYLISGIGKPKNFENLFTKNFPDTKIKKHFIFKDHHNYSDSDIQTIKSKVGDGVVITTEKDGVKLSNFANVLNLSVTRLKFVAKSPMLKFFEELE